MSQNNKIAIYINDHTGDHINRMFFIDPKDVDDLHVAIDKFVEDHQTPTYITDREDDEHAESN